MNDPKLDALERMTRVAIRKGDLGVELGMNLALILLNAGIITEEQYEGLERKCEKLEAAH